MTAGETWHSAGLIMQMRASDTDMRLRAKTREILSKLHNETGQDPGWQNNGGLYVARSKVKFLVYNNLISSSSFNCYNYKLDTNDYYP